MRSIIFIISMKQSEASSQLISTIDPTDVNWTPGLAEISVDRISLKYNEEATRQHDGTAEEQKKKQQEAAKDK